MNQFRLIIGTLTLGVSALALPLDFETPGKSLKNLIPDLSEATGLKLSVNSQFENLSVMIQAKGVQPTDLLTQIGNATGLTWFQADGGYRLDRSPEIEQKAFQTYYEYSTNLWKSWQENPPVNSSNSVDQIMLAFPAAELGRIVIGGRVVYADRRNANQLQLPTAAATAVNTILSAQQSAMLAGIDQRLNQEQNAERKARFQAFRDQIATPVNKRIVTIYRSGLNSYSVSAQGIDSEGNPRFNAAQQYRITGSTPASEVSSASPLDEEAIAKLKAFSQVTPTGNPYTSTLRQILLNPAQNEPVAFAIAPAIKASVPKSTNFVAFVPDESMIPLANAMISSGLKGLPEARLVTESKDGWLVIKPQLLTHAWITQRNRAALGRVTSEIAQTGVISLATQLSYANSVNEVFSTSGWENTLARQVLGGSPSSQLSTFSGLSLEGLQILSALGNRATAQTVVQLPSSSLSPAVVNPLLFNSPGAPSKVNLQAQAQAQAAETTERRGQDMERGGRGFGGERTEWLANTPPNGGTITVTTQTRDAIIARTQDGKTQVAMSERDLASLRASQLSGGVRSRYSDIAGTLNQFGMSKTISVTIQIQYPDGTRLTRRVGATEPAQNFGTYAQLPEQLQQETNQRANEYVQRASNPNQGRGGNEQRRGNRIPPPTS